MFIFNFFIVDNCKIYDYFLDLSLVNSFINNERQFVLLVCIIILNLENKRLQ